MALRIGCDLDGVLANMDAAIAEAVERLFGPLPALPTPPEASRAEAPEAGADAGPDATSADPSRPPSPNGQGQPPLPPNGAAAAAGAGVAAPAETVASSPDEAAALADELPPAQSRRLSVRQQRRLWKTIRETENFWERLDEIEPGMVARLAALAQARRWEVLFITQRPASAGDTCQLQTQRWLARLGFPYPSVYVIRGTRGRIAAALDLDVVIDDRPENCLDVVVDSKARSVLVWRGDSRSAVAANARRLGIQVTASFADCLDWLVAADVAPARPTLLDRIKKLINPI
jgi:hypothetical protein